MEKQNRQYDKEALLIFVKNLQKGKVKTRLAETIGEARALDIYRELLTITKSVVEPLEIARQVWYSDYIDEDDLWPGVAYEKRVQEGKNLGMRMQMAFRRAFGSGFEKVIIIGSDCAEISTSLLRQAFDRLNNHGAVIGPAADGGYYLLGTNRFYPDIFELDEWSTASVYDRTIKQFHKKRISYAVLAELNDIDTEADLKDSSLVL